MQSKLKQFYPVLLMLGVTALIVIGVALLLSPSNNGASVNIEQVENVPLETTLTPEVMPEYNEDVSNQNNPVAVLETTEGTVEIELYEDRMPITAGNFKKLVNEGFYDGIKFHRVIEGFMIQGGDPITKTDDVLRYGTGGPGYSIPDEHVRGDLLTNERGTISMANSGPNSGGSQFFINLVDNINLDFDKPPLTSKHPVFGRVVTGMDIVDKIGGVDTNSADQPLEPVVITKASVRE